MAIQSGVTSMRWGHAVADRQCPPYTMAPASPCVGIFLIATVGGWRVACAAVAAALAGPLWVRVCSGLYASGCVTAFPPISIFFCW